MAQAGSIDKIIGLSAQEKWQFDRHHATPEAAVLKDTQKQLKDELKAIGKSGDLRAILEAEKVLLDNERAFFANSKSMTDSLNVAAHEWGVARKLVDRVETPATYVDVDEAHSLPKNRIGGVPRDEARQFFKSHLARLLNQDKSRLSAEEKQIIDIRRSNLRIAEKTYTAQQKQALGIEADISNTRGKGPGLGLS